MRRSRPFWKKPIFLVPLGLAGGIAFQLWFQSRPAAVNPEPPPASETRRVASDPPPVEDLPPGENPPPSVLAPGALPEAPAPVEPALPSAGFAGGGHLPELPAGLQPVDFREVWGYLLPGQEAQWKEDAALTDVAVFSHNLDEIGELSGKFPETTLQAVRARGARAHLVIASSGQRSLLHFLLEPRSPARKKLLQEIAALAAKPGVQGLQLDIETLRNDDRANFLSFLHEARAALPAGMVFSLALPARTSSTSSDAYQYRELKGLADRFLIMVYDEHWRGGQPGSVSSKPWHDRVVQHALSELPREKVVIGLPFYGRIWQLETVAKATQFPELEKILAPAAARTSFDASSSSHQFSFQKTVTAQGWFDDAASLHAKFSSAHQLGATAIGFWRIGQEDPRVWRLIK